MSKILTLSTKLLILAAALTGTVNGSSNPGSDDIVARNLDSIAPANVRTAEKSRVVRGDLQFHILVGGSGGAAGSWDLVSSGRELDLVMQFGIGDWRGEQFTFNGSKVGIALPTSSHHRSVFGEFIASQTFVIKEGLLGGELGTGWALENLAANGARLQSLGTRKIDGQQALAFQYSSKHSSDMQVFLYFDPETGRHLHTTYTMSQQEGPTGDIRSTPYQREIKYRMEEQFSEFRTEHGITLPTHYNLQWSQETQNGSTRLFSWDLVASQIVHDVALDPANFEMK
ncbi:hypothetical protein [Occallatibacter savannae]|uniref:hypothetical protein n=1 Tax=Occallatibacter savannae TaxID=1002691 RepID=UPI000D68C565|nr:hypothetical protein [Occallatibacter savannae]